MTVLHRIREEIVSLNNSADGITKDQILVSFVDLQQQGRTLAAMTRKCKATTAEFKLSLDKLHLTLQNLNYESQYLNKEISKCEAQEYQYG